eukprot:Platyproteum_vivax@DN3270_c0_g1_i3.p1
MLQKETARLREEVAQCRQILTPSLDRSSKVNLVCDPSNRSTPNSLHESVTYVGRRHSDSISAGSRRVTVRLNQREMGRLCDALNILSVHLPIRAHRLTGTMEVAVGTTRDDSDMKAHSGPQFKMPLTLQAKRQEALLKKQNAQLITGLELELDNAKHRIKKLENDLKVANSKLAQMLKQENEASLNEELKTARSENIVSAREIKRLEMDVLLLRKQLAELEKSNNENYLINVSKDKQIIRLEEEVRELGSRLKETGSAEGNPDLERLEKCLDTAKQEGDSNSAMIEGLKARVGSLQERLKESDDKEGLLINTADQLRCELDEANSQLTETEEKYKKSVAEACQLQESLQAANRKLLEACDEDNMKGKAIQVELQECKREAAACKANVKELEEQAKSHTTNYKRIEDKCKLLENTASGLEAELVNSNRHLHDMETII